MPSLNQSHLSFLIVGPTNVIPPCTSSRKSLPASLTAERPLASVRPQMLIENRLLRKRLLAKSTSIRFLASMYAPVSVKRRGIAESLIANFANMGFLSSVCAFMLDEVRLSCHALPAILAVIELCTGDLLQSFPIHLHLYLHHIGLRFWK